MICANCSGPVVWLDGDYHCLQCEEINGPVWDDDEDNIDAGTTKQDNP